MLYPLSVSSSDWPSDSYTWLLAENLIEEQENLVAGRNTEYTEEAFEEDYGESGSTMANMYNVGAEIKRKYAVVFNSLYIASILVPVLQCVCPT